MKPVLAALAALAATPAATTASGQGATAPPPPPFDVRIDVPQDKGPQRVHVLLREFPVGGASGWHVHPGAEIAYLLAGEMSLEEAGRPARRLKPGDSFTVTRGTPHNGVNLGQVPARLVITYVTDGGAPLRTPVPEPHRH